QAQAPTNAAHNVYMSIVHGPQTSLLFPYTTLFRSLGRNRMTISGDALAAHVFEIMLPPILQVQRATIAIVHGGSDVGSQLLLQRSEEHTSELQSRSDLVCRLLLEKKKPNDVWSVPS